MSLIKLPQEILLQIVEDLHDDWLRPPPQSGTERSPIALLSLSTVCHRLHLAAEVYIYKKVRIRICKGEQEEQTRPSRFGPTPLHVLTKRLSRCEFIGDLRIDFTACEELPDKVLRELFAVLDNSCNVRNFTVTSDMPSTLDTTIFQTLDARKKIHELRVNLVSLEKLTKPGCFSELRDLKFSNIESNGGTRDEHQEWWENYELPVEVRGASTVRHLDILWRPESRNTHLYAILPVLSWIPTLEWLDIDFTLLKEPPCTLAVQRLLDVHASSLTSMDLEGWWPSTIPNLRHFPQLLDFRTTYMWLFNTKPEDAASRLSAPLLQELSIIFDPVCFEYYEHFKEEDLTWLKRFIVSYKSLIPVGGIKRIKLWNVAYFGEDDQKAVKDARDYLEQHQISIRWDLEW